VKEGRHPRLEAQARASYDLAGGGSLGLGFAVARQDTPLEGGPVRYEI